MLPRIDTSAVMLRTTKFFTDYNNSCPKVPHTRETATGPIEVYRSQGVIPESVTTTFHVVLARYIRNYNQYRRTVSEELQDKKKLPSLWTNALLIGKAAHCSDRTVRNHLDVLRELGLIRTKFHGSKRGFELWIKPDLLLDVENEPVPLNSPSELPLGDQRKNFPDKDSLQSNLLNSETGQAELCITHGESHRDKTDRQPGENPASLPAPQDDRERYSAAGAAARRSRIAAQNAEKSRERERQWLEQLGEFDQEEKLLLPLLPDGEPLGYQFARMLLTFWRLAKTQLYRTLSFTDEQQKKALVAIMAGVYDDFASDWTEDVWIKFQADQIEKIHKVRAYLNRHPNAYAAYPYAVSKPGCGYFDKGNINGFAGVEAWLRDDKAKIVKRKEIRKIARDKELETLMMAQKQRDRDAMLETMLRRAAMDFERLERGAKPRKDVAGMGILSLAQYHSEIFAGYGQQWHNKFLNQYEAQRARRFMPEESLHQLRRGRPKRQHEATVVIITPDMIDDGEGYYVD